jgi:hypothetical protein
MYVCIYVCMYVCTVRFYDPSGPVLLCTYVHTYDDFARAMFKHVQNVWFGSLVVREKFSKGQVQKLVAAPMLINDFCGNYFSGTTFDRFRNQIFPLNSGSAGKFFFIFKIYFYLFFGN